MKIVILDGFAVNPGDLDWGFLGKYGDYEVFAKTPDAECAGKCKGAEVVFTNRAKITAALLDECPTIKYVSALGTGFDMIDTDACRERGVQVVNIPRTLPPLSRSSRFRCSSRSTPTSTECGISSATVCGPESPDIHTRT